MLQIWQLVVEQPLSHIEVMETTERVKTKFVELVKTLVEQYA